MRALARLFAFLIVVLVASIAGAQPSASSSSTPSLPMKSPAQGIAVVSMGAASREDAFVLARAVYGSSLRPRSLDELRARILGGDQPPAGAAKDVRELAELRASVNGEDAASRRLLTGIGQQVGAQALLVVKTEAAAPTPPVSADPDAGTDPDAGVEPSPKRSVQARLFLIESGEFDAARYEPDETGSWKGTITSLSSSGRFPPPAALPVSAKPAPKFTADGKDGKENKPFYASPWFWAAVGGAILLGGLFYFTSQDNSDDPIHLQMKVPR